MNFFKPCLLTCLLFACGGGADTDLDLGNRDPRCVAACPETMPSHPDIGPICDAASRTQCLDQCEARIAGLSTVCQNCLVEDACFDPGCGSDDGSPVFCDETSCTISSSLGSCTYRQDDDAMRDNCERQINPRREIACAASFQPTTKCASVCQ